MSMFSSTFGQLADALSKEARAVKQKAPTKSPAEVSKAAKDRGAKKTSKAEARYAAFFAEPHTAPEGALHLDIFAQACLNQLYRYEKKGLVRRLPDNKPTGRGSSALQWQWIGGEK
ncbi:MAG: hypothetical protein IPG22_06340 [Acidobacteria bacterium]|jgi:hypothetical protein|nr:hypothetical protein [Acidobacteriota bacterium]